MTTGKRILVVDQDPGLTAVLRESLEAEGHEVVAAANYAEGLVLAHKTEPHLLITELRLPELDGLSLAFRLRNDPRWGELPVILLTEGDPASPAHARMRESVDAARTLVLRKQEARVQIAAEVRGLLAEEGPEAPLGRILVIEDDPANLEMIERRLEYDGFEAMLVETGEAGLEALRQNDFAAVLLDLRLPDMNGMEILAQARLERPDLPIVIMTAHGSEAIAVKALTEGAADYLIKPVGRREMSQSLRNAVERGRLRQQSRHAHRNMVETIFALQEAMSQASREHGRLVSLLQALEEGVIILGDGLRIEWINPAGLRQLRLSEQPADVPALLSGFAAVRDEAGNPVESPVELREGGEHFVDREFTVRWPDGEERTYMFTATPVVALEHDRGQVIVLRDVSEHRRRRLALEQRLRELDERLQAAAGLREQEVARAASSADRVKNEILAAVSHELRTPLNFILGFGSVLVDGLAGELTPEQRELLEKMLAGAERLTLVVEDLLNYAMLAAGMLSALPGRLPLDELTRGVAESFRAEAAAKGIRYVVTLDERLASRQPEGDRGFVTMILRHLIANALKFTPAGGRVEVSALAEPTRLVVADTGIGIPPEARGKLFERFFQAESQSTRRFGGTGLGLALVKGLSDQMGLTVEVESTPGKGSTFRVVWPEERT